MPTAKKRVTVSLNDKTYELFARFAKMQERPKSALISEILEQISPMMEGTVAILEKAQEAPDDLLERLHGVFETMEGDILHALQKADQGDLFGKKH